MYDLVALGELLIDFTMIGNSEQGNPIFERNPGGGPANMVCTAAKLGANTALFTKVGDDLFGHALKQIIKEQGVEDSYIVLSKEHKTTLAFVQLDENGERAFSFYRKNAADTSMLTKEFNTEILNHSSYFFFSSVLMAEGSSRETSFELADYAKQHGNIIVYDPNLRFNLWKSEDDLRYYAKKGFEYSDIVKVAEEELLFLMEDLIKEELEDSKQEEIDSKQETDSKQEETNSKYEKTDSEDEKQESNHSYTKLRNAAHLLLKQYPVQVLLVTLGGDGCLLITKEQNTYIAGYPVAHPVDTTAAGDSFTGGVVSYLIELKKPLKEVSFGELINAAKRGNAVASLTVQKKGAISALPKMEEVKKVLEENEN